MMTGSDGSTNTVVEDADLSIKITATMLNCKEPKNQPHLMNDDFGIKNESTSLIDGMHLSTNTEETLDLTQVKVVIADNSNVKDGSRTNNRRVVEYTNEETKPTRTNILNTVTAELGPVMGYAQETLLPLSKACAPLTNIVHKISFYVQLALHETSEEPPDGLTVDESAAIRLYTIEWEESHRSLYSMLNHTLKNYAREHLRPYFKYMKLLLTALAKLPCAAPLTVWRGVPENVSREFPPCTSVTWWTFSSCTTELAVLENNMYLGNSGNRTLFSIEAINGRAIRNHSHFVPEDEILLLPGTQMIVQSQFSPASNLHVIHLKQKIPKEMLLESPFDGAHLYPRNQYPWYRKKKFIIPICVLTALSFGAIVVGSVLGTRSKKNAIDAALNWNGNTWAYGCDFKGNDFSNIPNASPLCGDTCYQDSKCTHFTWTTLNGGTCFMKQGDVSKDDAILTNDPTMVCGVEYVSPYVILNQMVDWAESNTAYSCDFLGNDLSDLSSKAIDCAEKCSETSACTHFTWTKYNGGRCFMKQGNVSKADAVFTDDPNMVCGILAGSLNGTLNRTLLWSEYNWAYSCDFSENDLSNILTKSTDCSERCFEAPGCTHFTWTKYNGGTCFMKQGNVSKADAVQTNDPNMICGTIVTA